MTEAKPVAWRMRDDPSMDWITAHRGSQSGAGAVDEEWVESVGFAFVDPLFSQADYLSALSEVKRLREALGDLLTWFPEKPSPPEWRLKAGDNGADEAVEFARAALGSKS